jgi:hypothetical protein
MSLLFDISPEEVPEKKRKTPRKKAAAAEPAPATEPDAPMYLGLGPQEIIGRSGGDYTCCCGSTYFDILDDFRGEWWLECCFCGLKIREPAVVGAAQPQNSDFVFFDGRYSGMTLALVSETDQGLAYIRWCAGKHRSAAVKEACTLWLSSVGYTATQS